MLHQFKHGDNNKCNQHRRYMDEPSLVKQGIKLAAMFGMLTLILMVLP